jgi:HlyD family secretion protein
MAKNGSSSWGKWIVVLVIVGVVGGVVVWHFASRGPSEPQYQTVAVAREDIIQAVTATGTLNPVTNVTVGSQISGNIQKLFVDFNSKVTANQVVAQLDPATYQAAVAQAEGDLANAKANQELSKVEADRADQLVKNKLISQSDYDKAIATYHQADAQVKIKDAALQKARVDLSRCTIYAPVDGIVISRSVDVGQTVAASLSAPTLFIIANDLTKMQIDANVAEADVGGVEEGQDVTFTVDAFPYRTFVGKVVQVRNAPTTVQNVVTYDTVIGVDNPDMKLKPGMTANVSIVIAERKNALKVPNMALRFRPPESAVAEVKTNAPMTVASADPANNAPRAQGTNRPEGGRRNRGQGGGGPGSGGRPRPERQMMRTVYTLDAKGNLKPVQIKVGITDSISTEVIDGLSEGEQVITGINSPDQPINTQRPANPFGGGGGGFRRM